MIGNVPLTVRLGSEHITREVAAVGFRKEAVGGVRNITLRLARPLDRVDQIAAYTRVYLYDARSGETIAEGRLSDLGRSAGAGSGQQWDLVAFGPLQHASDVTIPLIYIDQSLEHWTMNDSKTVKTVKQAWAEAVADLPGHLSWAPTGITVTTSFANNMAYRALLDAGMKLGGLTATWAAGIADSDYRAQMCTHQGLAGAETTAYDAAFATGTTTKSIVVGTDFTNGHDIVNVRMQRVTTSITAADSHWLLWHSIYVRALLLDKAGTEITTGYTTTYVQMHDVVKDLLGRVLDQYDGANAVLTAGTYQIDQMAYPDGVTPAQVFDDLMLLEPAYYWTTGPSNAAGKFSFSWVAWPTTVRYETTLEDGASFPVSSQELYNRVLVRWRDKVGRTRNTVRSGACPVLDTAGVTRQSIIDLGDEIASAANAQQVGDNFLLDHKYPNNAGSLAVSRPIRDLTTGAMVRPHEIQPGELIRVRGVESYPDALNASSNDGQTVFRIWTMEYNSDSDTANLELDTYSRTTANALARLMTRRNRKR